MARKIPAGKVYSHAVVSRDILPTAMAAAGIPLPTGVEFDGVDLLPFLNGSKAHDPRRSVLAPGKGRAVLMGRWKLIECGRNMSSYTISRETREKPKTYRRNHPRCSKSCGRRGQSGTLK